MATFYRYLRILFKVLILTAPSPKSKIAIRVMLKMPKEAFTETNSKLAGLEVATK